MPTLFGTPLSPAESLGRTLIDCLAVAGGFLIGAILAEVGTKVGCKAAKRPAPGPKVIWMLRLLGGLIGALLTALIVFGSGKGGGLFSPGGGELSGGVNDSSQTPVSTAAAPTPSSLAPLPTPPASVPPPPNLPKTDDSRRREVRIYARGSPAEDPESGRFFVSDTLPRAMTLADLEAHLLSLRDRVGEPPLLVTIVYYRNSSYQARRDLERLLERLRLNSQDDRSAVEQNHP